MTNVYIAGPMRRIGPPDYNKQSFADAQVQLEALGCTVFNPHECDANKDRKPDDIRGARSFRNSGSLDKFIEKFDGRQPVKPASFILREIVL
jgi:hypothetical protein